MQSSAFRSRYAWSERTTPQFKTTVFRHCYTLRRNRPAPNQSPCRRRRRPRTDRWAVEQEEAEAAGAEPAAVGSVADPVAAAVESVADPVAAAVDDPADPPAAGERMLGGEEAEGGAAEVG